MENPIKPTAYEPEFTDSELEVMRAFAIHTGLTWLEMKEAARSIKRMGSAPEPENDHSIYDLAKAVTGFNLKVSAAVKIENRDRIPVPNKYKRNRFQR